MAKDAAKTQTGFRSAPELSDSIHPPMGARVCLGIRGLDRLTSLARRQHISEPLFCSQQALPQLRECLVGCGSHNNPLSSLPHRKPSRWNRYREYYERTGEPGGVSLVPLKT